MSDEEKLATVFGDEARAVEARVPPHDLDAEAAVLSACMNDRGKFDEVAEFLRAEHFYSEAHRRIWEACIGVAERNTNPDIVSVAGWLREHDRLAQVDGMAYLTTVLNSAPALANTAAYARTVVEHYRTRQLLLICQRGVAQGYAPLGAIGGSTGFINGVAEEVFALTCDSQKAQAQHIKAVMREAFEDIQRAAQSGRSIIGLETGFFDFDKQVCGLHDGELTVVAARPGMGKTAAGLNIADNVAGAPCPDKPEEKQGVIVFSLEMPRKQLGMRMIAARAGIDHELLRTGGLTQDGWNRVAQAASELANKPIWIQDAAGLTLVELRATVRRIIAEAKSKGIRIVLVVIDYLQLMAGRGDEGSREQEVSGNSRGLKQLAKDLGLPVVALAQVNRKSEERSRDHRPQLSDLRESGAIEQDADNIVFIYRDDYYNKESEDRGVAEWIVAKQRNGPTGTVRLKWNARCTRFENLAWDAPPEGHFDAAA